MKEKTMIMTKMTIIDNMVLGELSIFSKKGVELKTLVSEVTTIENDLDHLSQEGHLFGFDIECDSSEIALTDPIPNVPIHPLDISINGDYVSGSFKDSGFTSGSYKVKLWLMIEEEPEPSEND